MSDAATQPSIVGKDDLILITGASGFIGSRLVAILLDLGFRNLRCLARRDSACLQRVARSCDRGGKIDIFKGNLLSRNDCIAATENATVIYHLAAARAEKSVPDAYLNSVVTTRNLLDASLHHGCLKRFVNVSSFTVYSNKHKPTRRLLDETCPVESQPELRGEAYCFAKVKQDEIVMEYGKVFGIPYVIVRPGYVYGPGNEGITGRVGIGTFGIFLHLGGSNLIPLTYVDNCAEAIALAGLRKGVDREVFNVVDDDLPTSRRFLRLYKRHVRRFTSVYVPHFVSYGLCYFWERYSSWSRGQLPPAFNRKKWNSLWRKTRYTNQKLKLRLGWVPRVSTSEGLKQHFEFCRLKESNA
jgi:nucleoside-diphosphate-sugar epimerase